MARSGGGTTRPRRFRVEARCAWCGMVQLDADALEIHAGPSGDREREAVAGSPGGLLEFGCPTCRRLNLRRLTAHDVEVLTGVGLEPVDRPAPFELMEARSGPPITWDDLIDFHEVVTRAERLGRSRVEERPEATPAPERNAA